MFPKQPHVHKKRPIKYSVLLPSLANLKDISYTEKVELHFHTGAPLN